MAWLCIIFLILTHQKGKRMEPQITKEDLEQIKSGVGNPFSLGAIRRGDAVLDIGCGPGARTFKNLADCGLP